MKKYKIKCYACRRMYESDYPPPEKETDQICQDCETWRAEMLSKK